MSLAHYPFDGFQLIMVLECLDTALPPHPGLRVQLSSSGRRLYTVGACDAVSQWEVLGLQAHVLAGVDSVAWFRVRVRGGWVLWGCPWGAGG